MFGLIYSCWRKDILPTMQTLMDDRRTNTWQFFGDLTGLPSNTCMTWIWFMVFINLQMGYVDSTYWHEGRIFDEKRLWIFEGGNAMCMKSCFWSIIVSSDLWTVELQSLSPLVNAAATNSITPLTQQVDKVENIVCVLFVLSHRIPDTFYIPLTIQLCGHSIPFSLTNQFPGESLWSGILL